MTYRPFPASVNWGVDFDPSLVDRYAGRLQEAKASATPEQVSKVMDEALRTAAVDTGALEGLYATDRGFTRTVATQAAAWEMQTAEKGDHVKGVIEDAIAAYEMVLDAVTAQALPFITEALIRQLHEVMCASQQTYRVYVDSLKAFQDQKLPLGEYKKMPNSPTLTSGEVHDYASPLETTAEMERLIEELRTKEFLAAHPIVQAAYAHYAFVCVHPFVDGNGRVARALASVFLYRRPGVPLVIFADQKNRYLDALEAADAGSPDAFVQFLAERVIDTVNLVSEALSVTTDDALQSDLETIRSAMADGVDEGLLLAAERLRVSVQIRLQEALNSIDLSHRVSIDVVGPLQHQQSVAVPEGYNLVSKSGVWMTTDYVKPDNWPHYELCASGSNKNAAELLIVSDDGSTPFEIWRREIDPIESTALTLRLDAWAKAAVQRFIAVIAESI
jgi:Fic family protein